MVWSRCSAFRTVVDDERVWQRLRNLQKCIELSGDALRTMVGVDDGQMPLENRKGIAINRELVVKRNALLFGIEILRAQETLATRDGYCVDGRGRALYAMGYV